MHAILLFLLTWLPLLTGCNQNPTESPRPATVVTSTTAPADSASARLFRQVMAEARRDRLHERPLGEIMQQVGVKFLGKPYMAGLLDQPAEETLVCRLDGFDCVTFYETTLAMARAIKQQDYSWESFTANINNTRYRDGEMDGYCSRLHYFSDWVDDNEARENVRNITKELGGIRFDRPINFMTKNRSKYPHLASNDDFECLQDTEAHIAELDIFYIPENRIRAAYPRLKAGDIIGTATSTAGLDVTHTGLVYDDGKGGKGFLHASPSGGIKISPDLEKYIMGNKGQIGIIVVRPTADGSK